MAEAFLPNPLISLNNGEISQNIISIAVCQSFSTSWNCDYWTGAVLNGGGFEIPNNTLYGSLVLIIHSMSCKLVGNASSTVTFDFYPWLAYGYMNGDPICSYYITTSTIYMSNSMQYQYNDTVNTVYKGESTIKSGYGTYTVSMPNQVNAVLPSTSFIGFYFGSYQSSSGTSGAKSDHTLTVNYSLYGIQYSI